MNRKTEEKKRDERIAYILERKRFLFEVATIDFLALTSDIKIINTMSKKDRQEWTTLNQEYFDLKGGKQNEQRRILHDTKTRNI